MFEDENKVEEPPIAEDIRKFWSEKIWGDANKYKGPKGDQAGVRRSRKTTEMSKFRSGKKISENEINNQLAKSMNWKAPGIDCLSNFWLKSMPCCFPFLAATMNT